MLVASHTPWTEKLETQLVDEFFKNWVKMFCRSPKTRLAWTSLTGLRSPTYSTTRWWSRFEVLDQALNHLEMFVHQPNLPPATSVKIQEIVLNVES